MSSVDPMKVRAQRHLIIECRCYGKDRWSDETLVSIEKDNHCYFRTD